MKYPTSLEGPRLLGIVFILAALFGLSFAVGPVARAADDQPRVSITPAVPRRPNELQDRSDSFRLDLNLVLVPVLVTDLHQRPVRGLRKSDFRLFEDGAERGISQFSSEDSPISIGIVFDASASMRAKMDASRKAITEFLKMSLPGDEFFLLKFNEQPESVRGFTAEAKEIEDSLPSIQAGGWTAVYDTIYLGIHQMKHATRGRKVLLVLSDGDDNSSRYSEREIIDLVKESDVRIFSISILDRSHSLELISEASGGRAYRVRNLAELSGLAATVSAELHSEYVLGFAPAERPIDGKYRKVDVQVIPQTAAGPPLHTSWKRGYYSPAQ
jgi:Ca-activated chloride channel homolog